MEALGILYCWAFMTLVCIVGANLLYETQQLSKTEAIRLVIAAPMWPILLPVAVVIYIGEFIVKLYKGL